ncbi:MAG TPA: NAD(P)H-hydrate dehydratase [Flavobacterium sp.]|jgi:hydroxyethylthiazole kinase-like uncharacterized protein yjeF
MKTSTVNRNTILKLYKQVIPTAHKGTQGHALIIGGSYGKIGAVVLAAKAALHTGCGLVTAFIPECGYEILQSTFPEAMTLTDIQRKHISKVEFDLSPQAIGIGPGMGQEPQTQNAFHEFLQRVSVPLVMDADALNMLSANKSWLNLVPENSVLTPHPKEFERLAGPFLSKADRFEKALRFAAKSGIVLVLKDAPTFIVYKDEVYENTTGNAALATAGSGDVLTGMITSLIAQSYDPLEAAMLGVYLHGLTADIALPETGTQSFIASDIIRNIGKAYLSLH